MGAEQIDQITLHVKDLKEGVALFTDLLGAKFGEPVELNIGGRKAHLAFSNIGLGVAQLEEPVEGLRAIGFKDGRDHRAFRARANDFGGSFFAEQKTEGIDQDGFPGTCFPGQKVEPGAKLDYHVVDDRVVFQPQFDEHAFS